MIWEPFVLAVVLGLIISAALYGAYLWPSVDPEPPAVETGDPPGSPTAALLHRGADPGADPGAPSSPGS